MCCEDGELSFLSLGLHNWTWVDIKRRFLKEANLKTISFLKKIFFFSFSFKDLILNKRFFFVVLLSVSEPNEIISQTIPLVTNYRGNRWVISKAEHWNVTIKFMERRVPGAVSLILICMYMISTSKIKHYHSLHPQLIIKSNWETLFPLRELLHPENYPRQEWGHRQSITWQS